MNNPFTVSRTGTVAMTITEAHPYHKAFTKTTHSGAGAYQIAFDPNCPRCRAEQLNRRKK